MVHSIDPGGSNSDNLLLRFPPRECGGGPADERDGGVPDNGRLQLHAAMPAGN